MNNKQNFVSLIDDNLMKCLFLSLNEYEHILYKHSKKQSHFRGLFDSDVNYIYKIIIFIL